MGGLLLILKLDVLAVKNLILCSNSIAEQTLTGNSQVERFVQFLLWGSIILLPQSPASSLAMTLDLD